MRASKFLIFDQTLRFYCFGVLFSGGLMGAVRAALLSTVVLLVFTLAFNSKYCSGLTAILSNTFGMWLVCAAIYLSLIVQVIFCVPVGSSFVCIQNLLISWWWVFVLIIVFIVYYFVVGFVLLHGWLVPYVLWALSIHTHLTLAVVVVGVVLGVFLILVCGVVLGVGAALVSVVVKFHI